MAEKEQKEVKKAEPNVAKLVQVATQTAPAVELENGKVIDSLELLVLIYNKLLRIEKNFS